MDIMALPTHTVIDQQFRHAPLSSRKPGGIWCLPQNTFTEAYVPPLRGFLFLQCLIQPLYSNAAGCIRPEMMAMSCLYSVKGPPGRQAYYQ